jgi:hypothetical protein
MPNRNVPPVGMTDAFGGDEFDQSVVSIAHDFAALVAIFERQLDLVSPGDVETRSHILKAKEAAERGAKLSEQLVGLTQPSK